MRRPTSIAPKDWRQLVDAAGAFLDRWAQQASRLGWSSSDLFGCDALKPIERLDRAGLVLIIGAGAVVAITSSSAKIRMPSGSLLTFTRHEPRPNERRVLLWELQ